MHHVIGLLTVMTPAVKTPTPVMTSATGARKWSRFGIILKANVKGIFEDYIPDNVLHSHVMVAMSKSLRWKE